LISVLEKINRMAEFNTLAVRATGSVERDDKKNAAPTIN
jgi:hypothetical protein